MKATFTIRGALPSLNEYINVCRRNPYAGNKMKKDTDALICCEIKRQIPNVRFENPVSIEYLWVEKNRRRDKDNICSAKKFINDALQQAGTISNDSWKGVNDMRDTWTVDKDNPRIEITLTDSPTGQKGEQ